ncbi:13245_t:CDS:2 [Entrophospora sp. SA101]|nr:6443_t:CDS:2 [Entrophospora sp. SA101]CAJ0651221.1 5688_t:CDS:2 [Entrophospora sp. SA101]CAJ0763401.1 13245_t:CDS:2 [Entrophospora sp. SA101]CAJ0843183.1 12988_t:CDS:2 [Entrophospora sp. SA101]CAJ0900513.1 351_t:CDS:2 [Entrophospora sp. SA101]
MTDSETEDYMSSKYLEQSTSNKKATKTYSERRREKLLSNRGYIKPRQELEKESREKGLAKRIDEEDNIESPGLKILKKWGYRKGMALGESSKNEGITEPLGIELKQDRLGLGMSTELKQKAKVEYERKSKKIKVDEVTFRERIRQEHLDKRIRAQLKALQKICETLDTRKGIEDNILWHCNESDDEEKSKQDHDDVNPDDLLETMIKTIPPAKEYYYCFWCGCNYDNAEELSKECPGVEEDDHD